MARQSYGFTSLESAVAFPRKDTQNAAREAQAWRVPPASQDRTRIVFDCRMANDPGMIDESC